MRHFIRVLSLSTLAIIMIMSSSDDVAKETADKAQNDGFVLPDVDGIVSIVADTYWHSFGPLAGPDLVNFQIPQEKFAEVLQYFQQNVPDQEIRWDDDETRRPESSEIGTIRIDLKEGGCIRICWFDRGQNRLYFSCAGRRYVRIGDWIGPFGSDETLNVDGRIRKIHHDLIEKKGSEKADD